MDGDTMTCLVCNKEHHYCDWQVIANMDTAQKAIKRLEKYLRDCERAGLSTPEIHPMEDK